MASELVVLFSPTQYLAYEILVVSEVMSGCGHWLPHSIILLYVYGEICARRRGSSKLLSAVRAPTRIGVADKLMFPCMCI